MKRTNLFFSLALSVLFMCSCQNTTSPTASAGNTADTATIIKDGVIKTILERRSIRKYTDQPVENDKLAQIIECGLYAPNGMGRQSWEVRIVDNPKLLARIDTAYSNFLGKENANPPKKAAYGAPVLIFIAYDTTYDLSQVDCGLLGGNMMIAAQSMGIGSCCLGGICRFFNAPEGSELLAKLDFPKTHKLLYAIAFGYPDETPKAKPRMMEKVRYIE